MKQVIKRDKALVKRAVEVTTLKKMREAAELRLVELLVAEVSMEEVVSDEELLALCKAGAVTLGRVVRRALM